MNLTNRLLNPLGLNIRFVFQLLDRHISSLNFRSTGDSRDVCYKLDTL